tara:strand:+ start:2159 stop:2281 length:123 start_codon:yes stop_codon:yes gene_type:complete
MSAEPCRHCNDAKEIMIDLKLVNPVAVSLGINEAQTKVNK